METLKGILRNIVRMFKGILVPTGKSSEAINGNLLLHLPPPPPTHLRDAKTIIKTTVFFVLGGDGWGGVGWGGDGVGWGEVRPPFRSTVGLTWAAARRGPPRAAARRGPPRAAEGRGPPRAAEGRRAACFQSVRWHTEHVFSMPRSSLILF